MSAVRILFWSSLFFPICLFANPIGYGVVTVGDVYVSAASTNPVPPYSSWSNAAPDIQTAVDAASEGNLILVTNGIYDAGARLVAGDVTSNRLVITKKVTVQSVNGPLFTTIRGWQEPGDAMGPSAVRCAYLATNCVLTGFTLENGAARADIGRGAGGGVLSDSLEPVISNCIIRDNVAMAGAGVARGTLIHCVLSNNTALSHGGGGIDGTYRNCLIVGNNADVGGGVASTGEGVVQPIYATIYDPEGQPMGTILVFFAVYSGSRLVDCTVMRNSATTRGGGLCNTTIEGRSPIFATNCIVFGNIAPASANYNTESDVVLHRCCTTPLPQFGAGNFTLDPRVVNAQAGDYRLQSNSPCINAGMSFFQTGWDLDNNPRVVNGAVDLGAYEHQISAPVPLIPVIRPKYTKVSTGVPVILDAEVIGEATTTRWVFDDGTIVSNELSGVQQAWNTPGEYVVVFSAYNDAHPAGTNAEVLIQVLNDPVHYVSQHSANPVAPYSSWETAATRIQDAVDAAYAGGKVIVSNGVYSAGGQAFLSPNGYLLSNRVAVLKPLTLMSLNGPAATVIQGHPSLEPTNGPSAVRGVYLGDSTTLIGFTVTGGGTHTNHYSMHLNGGGVYCESMSVVVSNCVLAGNTASQSGGGAYAGVLSRCQVVGNVSSYEGGGVAHITGRNCLIADNSSIYQGGGAHYSFLTNCTVVRNSVLHNGGGTFGGMTVNCIIYENTASQYPDWSPGFDEPQLYYSCTTLIPENGAGNITNAPSFAGADAGNFRLQTNSPCINAGINLSSLPSMDLDGRPRVVGAVVDMGAYEYQAPGMSEFIGWLHQHNLQADGSADHLDGDGDLHDNRQEWLSSTSPTNAASILKIESVQRGEQGMAVRWQSVANREYLLERAVEFSSSPSFSVIASNIPGQAGTTVYFDTNAVEDVVYYRIQVEQ